MRVSAIRPRPDQIAELTRGIHLPLPEIPPIHLEIIAEGLHQAFADIRRDAPEAATSGSEAEVTALLEARLNSMIEDEPMWSQLVLCVVRGKESLSFDGSHLEKRPDLSIYLSDRNRGFPLIAEAKLIDERAAKNENLYCDKGIRRFVEGEYGWGSREAFMIAYVRDGSSIASKLTPFLSSAENQMLQSLLIESLPAVIGLNGVDLAHTRHGRSFVYAYQSMPSLNPGPISIWHLWLS
jgi:hypothetical protein